MTDPVLTGDTRSGMFFRGWGFGPDWTMLFRSRETAYVGPLIAHPRFVILTSTLALLIVCICTAWFFDEPVLRWLARTPPAVRAVAEYITTLGLSGYMLAISAAALVRTLTLRGGESHAALRREITVLLERCFYVFACIACSGVAAQVLKHVIGRARPRLIDVAGPLHFEMFSFNAKLASFPSGHATSIFSVATALGLLIPRLRGVLLGTAFVVASSRVVIGSHYVSDTIAGAGLGILVSMGLAIFLAKRRIAFTLARDRLLVKGSGSVQPALATALCGARVSS